jgi:formimidoylglutamate deiminase
VLAFSPDGSLRLPALTTAHSHAFQRAMRGRAQRPSPAGPGGPESGAPEVRAEGAADGPKGTPTGAGGGAHGPPAHMRKTLGAAKKATPDDFWTWRGQMYAAASALTPESIHRVSLVCYRELARAGVHTVGEFHYVHHQADGTPYDDRTVLADAVIDAARAAGLRIALLRVAYHRAGPGRDAEPGQRRFCDPRVDDVLRDVDTLRARYAGQKDVVVGLAPHSVRAVPPSWLLALRDYADEHAMPLHMHVAEQRREVDECLAETGRRPVELLADKGLLSARFVAVHATQLAPHEARLLGGAKSFACVCATTERDLGDGLPDLGSLREAGVRLCIGGDSHVVIDPIDDLRSLETHERLRTRTRVTFRPGAGVPAEQLWREGSLEGAAACGFDGAGGDVVIRRDHPALALVDDDYLLDAVVFGCGSNVVDRVETP